MRPSEAAAEYLRNDRGAWSAELAPMMCEPLDMLASREYQGVVYAGPARTGKNSSLVHGAIAYAVTCAHGDMSVIQMSQDAARDFSRSEVDRVFRYSPELAARLSPRARDDNTYDKFMRSGAQLRIGWPVISHVSSKTLQIVLLTDYERAQDRDDIGGEGPLWDLALKRTETYMSRGKVLAESSPGDDYAVADWRPSTPHEAPPARGILALYNAGTRARLYWPVPTLRRVLPGRPGCRAVQTTGLRRARAARRARRPADSRRAFARIACPHCGSFHAAGPATRPELRRRVGSMRANPYRVAGVITGTRRGSPIASYWQGGCSAVFQRWDAMVYRYFAAVLAYVRARRRIPVEGVTNTDFGASYLPRSVANRRTGAELRKRIEAWPQRHRARWRAVSHRGRGRAEAIGS